VCVMLCWERRMEGWEGRRWDQRRHVEGFTAGPLRLFGFHSRTDLWLSSGYHDLPRILPDSHSFASTNSHSSTGIVTRS